MKSLPIDTKVKVKEYGIGIIVDVLYSFKLMVKFLMVPSFVMIT